jgi:hypothetical protein
MREQGQFRMNANTAESTRRLGAILDELVAINFWDQQYLLQTTPDPIEVDGWKARRLRLAELKREFLAIIALVESSVSESRKTPMIS